MNCILLDILHSSDRIAGVRSFVVLKLHSLLRVQVLLGAAASGAGLCLSSGERDASDEGLPLVYDVDQINAFWDSRPHTALWRAAEIASTVVPFALGVMADRKMGRFSDERHCEARAVEFRELLTRLGPTFIKFGQMLSIRPDVLPSTLLYELQKLCDAVPSFPTSIALATIRSELQAEAADLFDNLGPDTAPIAAASLGQVYRCRLRTSGEWVAVKVQRPDMLRAVSLDIYLLRKYMHAVEFTKRSLTSIGLMNQPVGYDVQLLDTFAGASYKELDYLEEARSQKLFRTELLARMPDTVHVPAVRPGLHDTAPMWHAGDPLDAGGEFDSLILKLNAEPASKASGEAMDYSAKPIYLPHIKAMNEAYAKEGSGRAAKRKFALTTGWAIAGRSST
eukprot:gene3683-4618_t